VSASRFLIFPKSLGVDYVKAKAQEHESWPGFLFRGVAGKSEKYTTSPSEAMSSFNALRGLGYAKYFST
jgi:hypothetical protein